MRSIALVIVSTGCVVAPIDLEGLECPCASPYVCDEARNVCVERLGAADAGMDAGRRDAGMDAGIDAGIGDAGMSDAGPDAGPFDAGPLDDTICDDGLRSYTFCDGFESGPTFPEWDGVSADGTSGVPSLSTDLRYRGAGAFDTSTSMPSARAYINYERLGGITSGRMRLRTYMYVHSSPAIDHVAVMFLQAAAGGVSVEIYGDGETAIYLNADVEINATQRIPLDRWVCVEVSVNVGDASVGSFGLYFDGVPVAIHSGVDTREGGYVGFTVGLSWTDTTNPASHVLFDEVIFDRAEPPIGCD